MSTNDHFTILQTITLTLSLFSGIGQIIVASSSFCQKCCPLCVLSLSVLSYALHVVILEFSDHRSDLHILVLGLSVLSGSLQIIVLGLMTRKKIANSHELTNITLVV